MNEKQGGNFSDHLGLRVSEERSGEGWGGEARKASPATRREIQNIPVFSPYARSRPSVDGMGLHAHG